ncbi:MAG: glutathione S-transferase [Bdellovibrionaceae bacterium]|nr:glutathione S-transferase [Pseudobdellovibrionaceae bacterium]
MSDSQIQFYMNPQSRAKIVRWMLEELGQPYEIHQIEYGDAMKSPSYLAVNPMGKVPAIVHKGKIVTECAAICCYLAEAFPSAKLLPSETERADYYRWLFFAAGPLEAAVTNKTLGFEVPKERERMAGYGTYDLAMETLAKALSENDYIAGDRFTAADVYVGSHVIWGVQFKTMPDKDEFHAYMNRLIGRAAYQRANELDDALIEA